MLVDDIKKRIVEAMKAKRTVEREVLRVALAEMQLTENRSGKALTDEEAQKIVKKLIKSNEETLAVATDAEMKQKLSEENVILETLLPKRWSVDQIIAALAGVTEPIKAAKSDGQATGVAMKELKSKPDAVVDGKDVAAAVAKIRAP
jgi:uncharacterized protein YqeY